MHKWLFFVRSLRWRWPFVEYMQSKHIPTFSDRRWPGQCWRNPWEDIKKTQYRVIDAWIAFAWLLMCHVQWWSRRRRATNKHLTPSAAATAICWKFQISLSIEVVNNARLHVDVTFVTATYDCLSRCETAIAKCFHNFPHICFSWRCSATTQLRARCIRMWINVLFIYIWYGAMQSERYHRRRKYLVCFNALKYLSQWRRHQKHSLCEVAVAHAFPFMENKLELYCFIFLLPRRCSVFFLVFFFVHIIFIITWEKRLLSWMEQKKARPTSVAWRMCGSGCQTLDCCWCCWSVGLINGVAVSVA